jgi:4-amino-4-deoxy-L-arabinose transferase-like glycosyltransferase
MKAQPSLVESPRWWLPLLLSVIFLGAIAIRLTDLTNPPLDFQAGRQYFSAVKARGIYYQFLPGATDWQRTMAIEQWKQLAVLEPPVFEYLAAGTYLLVGHEDLWIPRIYASVFWVLGAVALFLVARELTSPGGGVIATIFYLYLPYGITASRSFQPDPLMVATICFFLWALVHWSKKQGWAWAIAAGLIGGLAVFFKSTAAFFVLGGFVGLAAGCLGIKKAVRNPQIWSMGGLIVIPTLVYYIYGTFIPGFLAGQTNGRFFLSFLIDWHFYVHWKDQINQVVGIVAWLLGLLGVLLFRERSTRSLVIGLWVGYWVYGLIFNYNIATHDYYQLPLIVIVALGLASVSEPVIQWLEDLQDDRRLVQGVISGLLILTLGITVYDQSRNLRSVDLRPLVKAYTSIGDTIHHDDPVIALTDYGGLPLSYYNWLTLTLWPLTSDQEYQAFDNATSQAEFEQLFKSYTQGKSYFIVTDFNELSRQQSLNNYLRTHFKVISQVKDAFQIYDLRTQIIP